METEQNINAAQECRNEALKNISEHNAGTIRQAAKNEAAKGKFQLIYDSAISAEVKQELINDGFSVKSYEPDKTIICW